MIPQDRAAFRIVSAFPGRVRIQLLNEHGNIELLRQLDARLATIEAVTKTDVSAEANSVTVRYKTTQRDLAAMVRAIETSAAAIISGQSRSSAPFDGVEPFAKHVGRASISPSGSIRVLHSFPGRVRLSIPQLRRQRAGAAYLESGLLEERGINSVETFFNEAFIIVHYDAKFHHAAAIVELVERLLAMPVQSPADHSAIVRARDIPLNQPRLPYALLVSTAAVALAATGIVPVAVLRVALALAALPLAKRAAKGARNLHFNVDQLDLTALLVLAWRGDFLIGSIMTWLIALGDVIRDKTVSRARREVSKLMSPEQQTAWLEREGKPVSVPVSLLQPGDTVLVYPGDQIPADGVVTRGRALVEQKMLTGEPMPFPKEAGDAVYALTMVADGQISMRVEHIGKATRAGRVVQMIENAPLSDTRIQNYAAKIGDRLVGPIFGLALGSYLMGATSLRVAGILILDFASGIRVSAPITILSAMTGAAKQGVFIKGGKALENLERVDAVVFDKTGTLTRGEPIITAAYTLNAAFTSDDVVRLAACAEANLKHPSAKAVVEAATARGLEIIPPIGMEYMIGLGVQAIVAGQKVQVGSERYMQQCAVDISQSTMLVAENYAAGNSLVYVAAQGRLIGLLAYSDPIRPESEQVIRALLDRGIKRIIMLTGDNERAAQTVARKLGITDVVAEAFPEHKADVVRRLCDEGYTVAIVGDGINDSPAFTHADVSLSLPDAADVAKEIADVILLDGDLRSLPRAIDLSREAMRILKQNVNIVVWPTGLGIAAAVVGYTTPLLSTLVSHGTTIIAGLNGLRPLFPTTPKQSL